MLNFDYSKERGSKNTTELLCDELCLTFDQVKKYKSSQSFLDIIARANQELKWSKIPNSDEEHCFVNEREVFRKFEKSEKGNFFWLKTPNFFYTEELLMPDRVEGEPQFTAFVKSNGVSRSEQQNKLSYAMEFLKKGITEDKKLEAPLKHLNELKNHINLLPPEEREAFLSKSFRNIAKHGHPDALNIKPDMKLLYGIINEAPNVLPEIVDFSKIFNLRRNQDLRWLDNRREVLNLARTPGGMDVSALLPKVNAGEIFHSEVASNAQVMKDSFTDLLKRDLVSNAVSLVFEDELTKAVTEEAVLFGVDYLSDEVSSNIYLPILRTTFKVSAEKLLLSYEKKIKEMRKNNDEEGEEEVLRQYKKFISYSANVQRALLYIPKIYAIAVNVYNGNIFTASAFAINMLSQFAASSLYMELKRCVKDAGLTSEQLYDIWDYLSLEGCKTAYKERVIGDFLTTEEPLEALTLKFSLNERENEALMLKQEEVLLSDARRKVDCDLKRVGLGVDNNLSNRFFFYNPVAKKYSNAINFFLNNDSSGSDDKILSNYIQMFLISINTPVRNCAEDWADDELFNSEPEDEDLNKKESNDIRFNYVKKEIMFWNSLALAKEFGILNVMDPKGPFPQAISDMYLCGRLFGDLSEIFKEAKLALKKKEESLKADNENMQCIYSDFVSYINPVEDEDAPEEGLSEEEKLQLLYPYLLDYISKMSMNSLKYPAGYNIPASEYNSKSFSEFQEEKEFTKGEEGGISSGFLGGINNSFKKKADCEKSGFILGMEDSSYLRTSPRLLSEGAEEGMQKMPPQGLRERKGKSFFLEK